MLRMALSTFRERWTLFVGTLLCVALGVALVESSVVILQAAAKLTGAASGPVERQAADDTGAFIALTLTVAAFLSVFIIGSTFAFTVNERRRDLALLRLTGATRRQLRSLLLGESIVVGLLGSLLGLVGGMGLVGVQTPLLAEVGLLTDALEPRLTALAVWVAFGSGVGLSVLGVWVASRRAAKVAPLDALRDVEDAARVMTLGRWVWGTVTGAATVAGLVLAQASSDPLVAITTSLLLTFSAAVALQQLSPLVVPLVARLGGIAARHHPEGEIAHANLLDGRRRAATTAGPLIALVGIVIGMYGVVSTQSAAEVRDRETTTRADLVIPSTTGSDTTAIEAIDGVATAVPLTQLRGRVTWNAGDRERTRRVEVVATDPQNYRTVMAPRLREGRLADFTDDTTILNGDSDGPFPADLSSVTLTLAGTSTELTVVARTGLSLVDFTGAYVSLSDIEPDVLEAADTRVMLTLAPDAEPTDVREALRDAGYQAVPTDRWAAGDQEAEADLNRSITIGLAGLGGLYALIAVVNAVALAAAARKRELAVTRLSGLTRGQVIRTSALEALSVSAIGVVLGGLAAACCLLAARRGFSTLLGERVLVIPWTTLIALVAVAITTVVGTATIGTWLATRTTPITLVAARE